MLSLHRKIVNTNTGGNTYTDYREEAIRGRGRVPLFVGKKKEGTRKHEQQKKVKMCKKLNTVISN